MVNSYILNRRKIAYTYNVTVPAAATPVTLSEVKTHLKIDTSDASEDSYLNMLINAATDFGEKYTGRDFINKTYTTFRNGFIEPLELRRSKVSTITSMAYLKDGVFTTINADVYSFENVNNFPYIYLNDGKSWPMDIDCLPQSLRIIFVSGYGESASDVPGDLKLALLNHIAFMYENRGDCSGDCNASNLPSNTKSIYDKRRIISIGSYEKPVYRL
jgi:uncharacterized phiE125 gp8 family phage protein